jgi:RNA 3'-phosphate cyclase
VIKKPFETHVEAVNCHHNYVQKEHHFGKDVLVTRKGAVSAREGELGIIPGSMGAKSFIVRGKGNPESFHSCSHGAGRTMSRTEAKRRYTVDDQVRATEGVECRKDAGVIDEIPMAYKDIDAVMEAQSDLVEVVHTLKQIVCVKGTGRRIAGGTHNPMAPPVQFLQRAWCPRLAEMGARIDIVLERFGFYPAGGGVAIARVAPCAALRPRTWMTRGERRAAYAEAFVAGIPGRIAQRELECVGRAMNWGEDQLLIRGLPADQGPGNALMLTLDYDHATEVFTAFGEKAVTSEQVARQVVQRTSQYLMSRAAFGEYLADQMMLPLALAGGGGFTLDEVSMHARTNAQVIETFLPVRFTFDRQDGVDTCTVNVE